MKENQASCTVMSLAYMRAYHAMHTAPKSLITFWLSFDIGGEKSTIEQYLTNQYLTWD
jgi:hypothetical protein